MGVLREFERKPEAIQRVTPVLRKAPQLVAQLREAHHWSAEWTLAEAWFQYVTHKRATAWHEAIVSLDEFREAQAIMKRFDGLDEKDLPTLDAFFKVRDEMYRRAAQTRQATAAKRRSDTTSRGRK